MAKYGAIDDDSTGKQYVVIDALQFALAQYNTNSITLLALN